MNPARSTFLSNICCKDLSDQSRSCEDVLYDPGPGEDHQVRHLLSNRPEAANIGEKTDVEVNQITIIMSYQRLDLKLQHCFGYSSCHPLYQDRFSFTNYLQRKPSCMFTDVYRPLFSCLLFVFEFMILDTETEKDHKSSQALQALDFGSSVYRILHYELDCHQLKQISLKLYLNDFFAVQTISTLEVKLPAQGLTENRILDPEVYMKRRVIFTIPGSLGSILFSTMISISSEFITTAKDVFLYSESTIVETSRKSNRVLSGFYPKTAVKAQGNFYKEFVEMCLYRQLIQKPKPPQVRKLRPKLESIACVIIPGLDAGCDEDKTNCSNDVKCGPCRALISPALWDTSHGILEVAVHVSDYMKAVLGHSYQRS
ncbi:hypothetical protein MJT46_006936 [Ovis ammon polii x Ovis aries]|nr:hypothetical protein MJT46_006936 [Ovis ammon polii x Ovis aries]